MALQVWLPLMGDVHNQGLYPLEFTNTNAQVSASGCLGSCYSFTAMTGTGINAAISSNDFLTRFIDNHSFSLCCWFKTTDATSTPPIHITYGVRLFVGSSNVFSLYNSARTVTVSSSQATNDGKWHHIVGAYDAESGKMYLYIDGELKSTNNYTAGYQYVHTWNNQFHIGRNPNDSKASASYFYQGSIQDVRFYDHCLSAKEVKELSKGLVQHFKLNDKYSFSTTNLIQSYDTTFESYNDGPVTIFNNQMNNGTIEVVSDVLGHSKCLHVRSNGGSNRCYTYFSITAGTYVISVDYYNPSSDFMDPLRVELNGGGYSWNGFTQNDVSFDYGEWKRYYLTITATATTTCYLFFMCLSGQDAYFDDIQMEKGSYPTAYVKTTRSGVEFDCSGYRNDGTLHGSPSIDGDSQRYDASTAISDNNFITAGRGSMVINSLTVSIWAKMANWGNYSGRLASCTEGGGWNFESGNGYLQFPVYAGGYAHAVDSLPLSSYSSGWHHFVGTFSGADKKVSFYRDGQFAGSAATANSSISYHPTNVVFLGAEAAGNGATPEGGLYFNGSLSDFRVYGTALSDEDIAELYHTGASVDNNGNFYCYELKEV